MKINLTTADSAVVRNVYDGDYSKYIRFRQSLVLETIRNASWERTSFFLNISKNEAIKFATELSIDSPYYLLAFMRDSTFRHPYKSELLSKVMASYSSLTNDKNSFSYSNNRILNLFFSIRMKNRSAKYHQIKDSFPDLLNKQIICEIFMIDVSSYAKEKRISDVQLIRIVKTPSLNMEIFNLFIEKSKDNFKLNNPNITNMQFYHSKIHNYCFNQAGGYELK